MGRALLAWIGQTDIDSARDDGARGIGPIAQALAAEKFDHVVLLNNYDEEKIASFRSWVGKRTPVAIEHRQVVTAPTDYSAIYRASSEAASSTLQKHGPKTALTFHLSPGTKPMAITWVILAKTRFDARLIESSTQAGVQSVDFPFQISAEFIPSAVRQVDEDLG
ncbi:MAG: AAA family ATPase, partial [Polyangiaceae bacterium]